MRLVSLNTWKAEGDYPQRLRAMAEGLSALHPDVVALQEDMRTPDGQTHTALALSRALGLRLNWIPARDKMRRMGVRHVRSTAGLAVLSREPAQEVRTLSLPDDPADGERVAQCVRLPGPSGDWWLVNLHLTHLPHRPDLRHAQLKTVLGALAFEAGMRPVVLCGDFNAGPGEPEQAVFRHPFGPLLDAFGNRSKLTHRDERGHAANLDHILLYVTGAGPVPRVHRAWTALDRPDAHGVMSSDHWAVCADLF